MEKKVYEPGIYDISNADYHAAHGLSRSNLMHFKRTPAHFQYEFFDNTEARESTAAMIMGEAVHTLVLEPHTFDGRFAVRAKVDGRTKAGKEYIQAFAETSLGKTIIDSESYETAVSMSLSVNLNDLAPKLLENNRVEQSIFFKHEGTGLTCKARPDAFIGGLVNDIKTTADASVRSFESSAVKYGYYLQAGMIKCALKSIGIDMKQFTCIAIEKTAPYAVAINIFDDEAIEFGVNQLNEIMQNLIECMFNSNYPAYGVQTISVPRYATYDTLIDLD